MPLSENLKPRLYRNRLEQIKELERISIKSRDEWEFFDRTHYHASDKRSLARSRSEIPRQKTNEAAFESEMTGDDDSEESYFGDSEEYSKNQKDLANNVMFSSRRRPRSERLHRKERNFRHPTELSIAKRNKLSNISEQEQIDLAIFNSLIAQGNSFEVAQSLVKTKFAVAQYRGLFYNNKHWNKLRRKRHRNLDELGRPVFSSSALAAGAHGLSGYYYLYSLSHRQDDLAQYSAEIEGFARQIRRAHQAISKKPPLKKEILEEQKVPNTGSDLFQPQNMMDIATHTYSQDYDFYHQASARAEQNRHNLETPEGPLDPMFEGLLNADNPLVSTGDIPTHAFKYAFGLKFYGDQSDNVLEPAYDRFGKPRHPYSGKAYTMLHPIADYDPETGPRHLVSMQNQRRINLGQVVIPERETQFDGMIEKDRVAKSYKAKFPDFSKGYKEVYLMKYGLTEDLFNDFSDAIRATENNSDERTYVEALLSKYLSTFLEMRAVKDAEEIAKSNKKKLVYRQSERSFGFSLPNIDRNRRETFANKEAKERGIERIRAKSLKEDLEKIKKESTIHKDLKALREKKNQQKSLDKTMVDEGDQFKISKRELIDLTKEQTSGQIIKISGAGLLCYLRSLVTAAAMHRAFDINQIEYFVRLISDHLASVGLREVDEMIDAGDLVAAEISRVMNLLGAGNFDPSVQIFMQNENGHLTSFTARTGGQGQPTVRLLYTPGHFDLIWP